MGGSRYELYTITKYNYAHRIDGDGVWGGTWAVLAWLRETVVSWEDLE